MPVDDDDVVPGLGKALGGRQPDDAGAQYTDFHFRVSSWVIARSERENRSGEGLSRTRLRPPDAAIDAKSA